MTRPIAKEAPAGSPLAAYIVFLNAENPVDGVLRDESGEPLWRSTDPALRHVGVCTLMKDERRLWKLPRDFVREELVLPAIAEIEGPEAARALKTYAPNTLRDYVDLICDAAHREATSRRRQPHKLDNSSLVTAIIWAAVSDGFDSSRSMNANFERARLRLGLERGVVRRTVAKVLRALAAMDKPRQSAFNAATIYVREQMAERDRRASAQERRRPVLSQAR